QDIWLNEGFANYMYALVLQHFYGEDAFKSWRENTVENITSQPGGSVYVPEQDSDNVNRIFSSRLSYDKGGMVLHMLHRKLGDEDFFQGLRNYLNDPDFSFGFADTQDLIAELEAQSGQDLTTFFDEWIYGEGYPTYHVDWFQQEDGTVHITVTQEQSKPNSVGFFEGELPIRLLGDQDNMADITLTLSHDGETFTKTPGFTVNQLKIDPGTQVISRNNSSSMKVDAQDWGRLKIYANPAKKRGYIKNTNAVEVERTRMFAVSGKLILDRPYQEDFSVSSWQPGLYFIRLNTSDGEEEVKSLIVK